MTILELKQYFQNTKEPKFFLNVFFSWRGNYSEIAFTPTLNGTKEESLSILEDATRVTCGGLNGGQYNYDDYTTVHFEFYDYDMDDNALYEILLNYKFNSEFMIKCIDFSDIKTAPILIYKLSKLNHVNIIEMTEGYVKDVIKFVENTK